MKISGITLFPFILIQNPKDLDNKTLINHEKIHLRQQVELLIIFFYILYVGEFLLWYLILKNPYKAYRSISFEQEAYDNEENLNYLRKRKLWSFRKYYN